MKKLGNKVGVTAGLAVFVAATWLAFKTPTAPPLPETMLGSSTVADIETTTTAAIPNASNTAAVIGALKIAGGPGPAKIIVRITDPTSSSQWVIGDQNTITWSRAAGVTGQIYLVNAISGIVAGWVEQTIGPAQTVFPWNTRDIFLSETNPLAKDVAPGKYILKMAFQSPQVPIAVSAPFWIIMAPTSTPASPAVQ